MQWHHYLSAFFSGVFLANMVPHFTNGISGDSFPTPFSNPRGVGLSSPVINVVWALFNGVIGFVLWKAGQVGFDYSPLLLTWFAGFAVLRLPMAKHFSGKMKA